MNRANSTFIIRFFRGVKYWSSTISALGMVVSLLYVVYSSGQNLELVHKTIEQTNERLALQKKSIPSHFTMVYRNVNEFNEQAYIINTGNTVLYTVSAHYGYYFVDSNNHVVAAEELVSLLHEEAEIETKFIDEGLITHADDISGLLGTSREFDIAYLDARKETLVEVSSSSIQNAIRISELLGYEVFARWMIKYNEELSNEEVVRKVYIWMQNNRTEVPQEHNQYNRKDLGDTPGGDRIISLISDYEKNTKEVIFRAELPVININTPERQV